MPGKLTIEKKDHRVRITFDAPTDVRTAKLDLDRDVTALEVVPRTETVALAKPQRQGDTPKLALTGVLAKFPALRELRVVSSALCDEIAHSNLEHLNLVGAVAISHVRAPKLAELEIAHIEGAPFLAWESFEWLLETKTLPALQSVDCRTIRVGNVKRKPFFFERWAMSALLKQLRFLAIPAAGRERGERYEGLLSELELERHIASFAHLDKLVVYDARAQKQTSISRNNVMMVGTEVLNIRLRDIVSGVQRPLPEPAHERESAAPQRSVAPPSVDSSALIVACEKLAPVAHDPFGLGKDYAAPGSYMTDLAKKVGASRAPSIELARFLEWGQSWEQTALYDAIRAFIAARGRRPKASERIRGDLALGEQEVRFVDGDLTITGHLKNAGTLLVRGNLAVKGRVSSLGEDPASGTLWVGGSAHAFAFHLMGPVIIEKDLTADHVIYGRYFDDSGMLWVGGTLTAPLFAEPEGTSRIHASKAKRLGNKELHERFPKSFSKGGDERDLEAFLAATTKRSPRR